MVGVDAGCDEIDGEELAVDAGAGEAKTVGVVTGAGTGEVATGAVEAGVNTDVEGANAPVGAEERAAASTLESADWEAELFNVALGAGGLPPLGASTSGLRVAPFIEPAG